MSWEAIIFDMDGVIIDSEGLWKQAEREVFSTLGVNITDEYAEITQAMTPAAVTQFWFEKYPWKNIGLETVEQRVISRVAELINAEDCEIKCITDFIKKLKSRNYKIGLATNSPQVLIPVALKKSGIIHLFDAVSSAEHEINGKPDPAVYLTTAARLKVAPHNCLAVEDSYPGMVAAKKAGMRVLAFTNGRAALNFEIADFKIDCFDEFDFDRLM